MNTDHPLLGNILAMADPLTWQRSVDAAGRAVVQWLDRMDRCDFTRVTLVGCGTSFYAAQVGKYILEHIAHLPAEAVQAFDFATYADPALLDSRTLVVGISATGKTAAARDALRYAQGAGSATVAVTAETDSDVADASEVIVPIGGDINVGVKTRTYIQSLIALYVLALRLGEVGGQVDADLADHWHRQIDLAAEGSLRFLDRRQGQIEELAKLYAQAPNVFVLGTGPNAGTAEEASLKVIEMAKMFSDACPLEEFLHGRLREVDGQTPMFFVAPQGRASDRVLDFLTVTDQIGVPSVVLTDRITSGIERLATHVVHLPVALDEFATPLLYILPLYLFGYHAALQRGYDPGSRRYPDIVPQDVRYRAA